MQTTIATLLGGLANKSDSPNTLQRVLDMAPTGTGDNTWSSLANSVGDANSPLMSAGRRIVSTLFPNSEGAMSRALEAGTGLRGGTVTSLLTMAAPMLMSFLSRRVRDQGMTMGGLGGQLQSEIPAIRSLLPTGVTDLLWPHTRETITESPVVARSVQRETSSKAWVLPLVLLALIPALAWLFNHARRPVIIVTPPPQVGTANRSVEIPVVPRLIMPRNVDLYFATGSTRLRPDSQVKLKEFTDALASNRDARVLVNGYTDNVGSAASNMRISQDRANMVKEDLVRMGIPEDRVSAQGFGEENPIADNNTAEGRATNRRVSVGVGTR
jgi:outer membrane protein OmpA-like peptidoglycan-associated protein